ncbi:uncharacterized membrane protein (DUF4010 family) [Methylohalomonas lacus]|uniref:Uncharacterized membrane protein (DUF4010 family) n=1 Tax=Methylohalomonas lacus TaxID=398773 RepID=A0AAE3HLL6_9GAMM|nr:MgtC/SapB family protein [Methylohalomonas lacus]MCS3903376.1 uncharacterized membrane protein (DUF4010 family) [Methylohalomonas lacus]
MPFYGLGVALLLGLLIGLERGWKDREQAEGQRVAGIRTFALIGLLGGVCGLLAQNLNAVVLAVAFVALAVVLGWAHAVSQQHNTDVGITGVIAGLLTFTFGALAMLGEAALAATGAVITVLLLGMKPTLHAWVRRLEKQELHATLKLLLISVVILPLLPNEGFGPWQALNPYKIWWMVVLIAAISFVGYFATRIIGARKGIMVTGLFAGLASSTAVTLHLARLARHQPGPCNIYAAGILLAWATMFPRMLIVSSLFSQPLALALLVPAGVMTVVAYTGAWLFWRQSKHQAHSDQARLSNPFELKPALIFAALLAAIMLLSHVLREQFGDTGTYLLAAASGIADVDAITLSLADMAGNDLRIETAALALLIAAFMNTFVKTLLAIGIGGSQLGRRAGAAGMAIIIAGMAGWWLFH